MLRMLHTADLHLETPFTGSGLDRDHVVQRRADLFAVFRRIIELTRERQAQVLLIAGDLFEEDYITSANARRMFDLIGSLAPLPVLISPGNHDPFHDGSPYALENLPPNLHLFRTQSPETVTFPDLNLAVHGLAFRSVHVPQQLWKGFHIPRACEGMFNVMLTHGATRESEESRAAKYLPIDPADLRSCGADYVALGHYHTGFTVLDDRFKNAVRAAYPGSPEPLRAGREGEHGVLLVEIDPDSHVTTIERIVTQQRVYRRIECDLSDMDGAAIDREILRRLRDNALVGGLVELRLNGRIPNDLHLRPQDYLDAARDLFAFTFIDDTAPDFDFEAIATEDTARGAFCRMLRERIAEAASPDERETLEDALWLGLSAFEGQSLEEIQP